MGRFASRLLTGTPSGDLTLTCTCPLIDSPAKGDLAGAMERGTATGFGDVESLTDLGCATKSGIPDGDIIELAVDAIDEVRFEGDTASNKFEVV